VGTGVIRPLRASDTQLLRKRFHRAWAEERKKKKKVEGRGKKKRGKDAKKTVSKEHSPSAIY